MSTENPEISDTTAQFSTVVKASRTTVWNAMTDPAAIKEYFMGADVETDWIVGSPSRGPANGRRTARRC